MKKYILMFFVIVFIFYSDYSYSQYKGGSYDGYYSKIDSGIRYPVGIIQINSIAEDFVLKQNYPNPFNPSTVISYNLKTSGYVTLKIYNIEGKEIYTIVDQRQDHGSYSVTFDARLAERARNLSSGVYFYKLDVNGIFTDTKKMILNK